MKNRKPQQPRQFIQQPQQRPASRQPQKTLVSRRIESNRCARVTDEQGTWFELYGPEIPRHRAETLSVSFLIPNKKGQIVVYHNLVNVVPFRQELDRAHAMFFDSLESGYSQSLRVRLEDDGQPCDSFSVIVRTFETEIINAWQ